MAILLRNFSKQFLKFFSCFSVMHFLNSALESTVFSHSLCKICQTFCAVMSINHAKHISFIFSRSIFNVYSSFGIVCELQNKQNKRKESLFFRTAINFFLTVASYFPILFFDFSNVSSKDVSQKRSFLLRHSI